MTVASDTEWLRSVLNQEHFHQEYAQKWVAVRNEHVVYSTPNRTDMESWLEQEDKEKQCVLAFGDNRNLV
jgi:hypothetical protein